MIPTIRLAFYYRIFPIRLFRHLVLGFAVASLLYMVAIDLTIIFQWYIDPASLSPLLKLRYAVILFTTPGIESTRA